MFGRGFRVGAAIWSPSALVTRVFDGRIIESDGIEPKHREVLKCELIEAISDPMRKRR
jgi:hypothetical protein